MKPFAFLAASAFALAPLHAGASICWAAGRGHRHRPEPSSESQYAVPASGRGG
jgi:hypothetical protein